MEHLDRNAVQALLRGDPDAIARYGAHLDTDCEQCELLMMEDDLAPELDGEVDRMLLELAPPAKAPLDQLGFRRLQRTIGAEKRAKVWPAISAMAAVLVVGAFGVLAMQRDTGPDDEAGIKGTRRIAVELQLAMQTEDGELRRVESGETLPAGAGVVLLRYHATEKGTASLVRQIADEAPEILGTFELEPGTHDLASVEGVAGVPLPDTRGKLRLWLVASPARSHASESQALKAIEAESDSPFTTAGVELEIE